MTNQQHPITPPLEMLQQWASEYWGNPGECLGNGEKYIATKAAQWSADQELEAIFEMVGQQSLPEEDRYLDGLTVASIRAARRPKPPSLKEQALKALREAETSGHLYVNGRSDIIRLALKQLND